MKAEFDRKKKDLQIQMLMYVLSCDGVACRHGVRSRFWVGHAPYNGILMLYPVSSNGVTASRRRASASSVPGSLSRVTS